MRKRSWSPLRGRTCGRPKPLRIIATRDPLIALPLAGEAQESQRQHRRRAALLDASARSAALPERRPRAMSASRRLRAEIRGEIEEPRAPSAMAPHSAIAAVGPNSPCPSSTRGPPRLNASCRTRGVVDLFRNGRSRSTQAAAVIGGPRGSSRKADGARRRGAREHKRVAG